MNLSSLYLDFAIEKECDTKKRSGTIFERDGKIVGVSFPSCSEDSIFYRTINNANTYVGEVLCADFFYTGKAMLSEGLFCTDTCMFNGPVEYDIKGHLLEYFNPYDDSYFMFASWNEGLVRTIQKNLDATIIKLFEELEVYYSVILELCMLRVLSR